MYVNLIKQGPEENMRFLVCQVQNAITLLTVDKSEVTLSVKMHSSVV